MQDFSIADLPNELPRFLELVASGEQVRLCNGETEIAVVTPSRSVEDATPRGPISRMLELREKYNLAEYGFTKEEVDSWRDRSPGREPPSFE
ncbi:hypothetical protein [Botrimarina sp.]|uniref:hypothetical protein n=1 Tax=Botrimarina sp. TaxID=2795802 RepID=UPI0032ED974C